MMKMWIKQDLWILMPSFIMKSFSQRHRKIFMDVVALNLPNLRNLKTIRFVVLKLQQKMHTMINSTEGEFFWCNSIGSFSCSSLKNKNSILFLKQTNQKIW